MAGSSLFAGSGRRGGGRKARRGVGRDVGLVREAEEGAQDRGEVAREERLEHARPQPVHLRHVALDNVTGRYFLVATGEEGWSIGDTEFAPPHSFILAFAGTEPPTQTSSSSGIPFCEGFQDGIPLIKAPVDFPIKTSKGTVCYQTYKGMFNVSGRASHCIPSLPVLRRAARPTPAGAPADV